MLTTNVEGVTTCHKSSSTRGALRLNIVLFEDNPLLCEACHCRSLHGWVVPGDIVEAEIISEYEKNMRLSVELGSSLLLL